MANNLLTPKQAAEGLLKITNEQIKQMKKEGMTEKQINDVLDAVFGSFMYGKL